MRRICSCMVILMTFFSQPVFADIYENTKTVSDFQNSRDNIAKTAFIGTKYLHEDTESKSAAISESMNTILPDMELDTLKLEKGRKFVVVSDSTLSSDSISGIPVRFESVQKEYLAYDKKPSKIVFHGKIEKTRKPRLAGKSGTVKVKLEKITIDKITYPVSALISKIDDKNVYFNTLSGAPLYGANLADSIANGTIHSSWKDPCGSQHCTTSNNIARPVIYLSAAALQAADLLISPFASLFKHGSDVTIPKKTFFEIKLDKDMYVLNL